MSEWNSFNSHEHSANNHNDSSHSHHSHSATNGVDGMDTKFIPQHWNSFSSTEQGLSYADIISHTDPLSQCHSYVMKPIDWNHVHVVKPHIVSSYVKADGTYVAEHIRGEGAGYLRSNQDSDPTNNLRR